MKQEKKLPRSSMGRALAVLIAFAAVEALVIWLAVRSGFDGLLVLPIVVVPALSIYLWFSRRRCPHCGRRLIFRWDRSGGGSVGHRLFLDCRECEITWRTGFWTTEN